VLDVQVGMENGLDQLETISFDAESVLGRRHHFTEGTVTQQMPIDEHQIPEPKTCQIISRVGKDSAEEPPTVSEDSRTEALGRIGSSRANAKKVGHVFEAAKRKLHKWTLTPFIGGVELARGLLRNHTWLQV
jgi:hypothetical protein